MYPWQLTGRPLNLRTEHENTRGLTLGATFLYLECQTRFIVVLWYTGIHSFTVSIVFLLSEKASSNLYEESSTQSKTFSAIAMGVGDYVRFYIKATTLK